MKRDPRLEARVTDALRDEIEKRISQASSVSKLRNSPGPSSEKRTERNSKDIHLGLKFWIQIESIEIAGFAECSGLSIETEVMEYAEGGQNSYTHRLPVRTKYGPITLKRGLDPGRDLHRWYVDSINGNPKGRKNVSIIVYGQKGEVVYQWDLLEAFPSKWIGPDLKTDAGAVAVETIEISHHGLSVSSK